MTNLLAAAVITISSWYGAECEGKLMANGKPFNPAAMTCASWDYPFGTQLRIVHNARSIKVTVTDRGPAKRLYRKGRRLDLSRAAFKQLAPLDKGLIRVRIFRLDKSR
jgi:rare lipoprotein A